MSLHTRHELIWSQAKRYRDSNRSQKTMILNEFCQATGYNRKYAIGVLNRPPVERGEPMKRQRASSYSGEVGILERLWEISGRLCGKRLVPAIPMLINALERHGELDLAPARVERLCQLSPSTADRLLKPKRRQLRWRGKTMTRPGSLLRKEVPVRTFADWDDLRPGFFEADLVAHCGDSGHGEFVHTLTLTDISTGWTDMEALKNRSQATVCEAIERMRQRMPFPILGIDSDNGSEFINGPFVKYCKGHEITFTRCRPYKKNDQCHVESKNWSVVRVHAGYWRYDTPEALHALRKLYSWLRLSVNFFRPSLKLKEKVRDGAKITKKYDRAATPYEKALQADILSQAEQQELSAMFATLNPAELHRQIEAAQSQLYKAASVRFINEATKAA